jgi:hypothetical protein
MRISYQPSGRCFWHRDCTNHFGGVMRVERNEPDRSLLRCLHCQAEGWYPVGAVGERKCERLESAAPAQ